MTTTKKFPTLDVMGVYTGFVLREKGMSGIHDVMDHFYPGIMTIGVAAMQPNASREVLRQLPQVAEVKGDPADWHTFAKAATDALGDELELAGPLNVSNAEATKAFAIGRRP